VDAVSSLLDGPRARRAFLLRSLLTPPWAIEIRDEAPLSVIAMVRGQAWIIPDTGGPLLLTDGSVAVVQGPDHYRVADTVDTPTQVVIHPGQRCTSPDGEVVYALADLGVRTWGNDPDGPVAMVTGTYPTRSEVGRRLLDALPAVAVTDAADVTVRSLVDLLAAEIGHDSHGQAAMLDRILDLVLIAAVRSWFLRPDVEVPGWYRAHADPVAGAALRMLHRDVARPWTVDLLARECGVARATCARRFTELVGEPPMAYLTALRIDLAADLLLEPDATLESVARRVGYGTAFSLSAAFTRVRGVTPRQHRDNAPRSVDVVAELSSR
jgi:AraC-like DNA-binding protein